LFSPYPIHHLKLGKDTVVIPKSRHYRQCCCA